MAGIPSLSENWESPAQCPQSSSKEQCGQKQTGKIQQTLCNHADHSAARYCTGCPARKERQDIS